MCARRYDGLLNGNGCFCTHNGGRTFHPTPSPDHTHLGSGPLHVRGRINLGVPLHGLISACWGEG
jgi:hypothetical protein